jgi:hypothetical protein
MSFVQQASLLRVACKGISSSIHYCLYSNFVKFEIFLTSTDEVDRVQVVFSDTTTKVYPLLFQSVPQHWTEVEHEPRYSFKLIVCLCHHLSNFPHSMKYNRKKVIILQKICTCQGLIFLSYKASHVCFTNYSI